MKDQRILMIVLTLALLLIVAVGLSQAQGPGPDSATEPQGALGPAAAVSDEIPIQGRLTDASGSPISGTRTITFTLYDSFVGGTAVCQDVDAVFVVNGLFSARMDYCTASDINGQQLYLGIQVQGDPEMLDRQAILPVPYAWSLRPGANISGTVANDAILHVENSAADGRGLQGYATAASGTNYGVVGRSSSPDGYGGLFQGGAAAIVLGGTPGDDDGEIHSDPAYTSSDIVLISNDEVHIHLDENEDEDGSFQVNNGANESILGAYESGRVRLGINAGDAMTITVGDRYRDNATIAWAKVGAGGTASAEFGVASVTKDPGSGSYLIALDAHAASATALIPIAIAEVESLPANAGSLRIVSINQASTYTFRVYINDGAGTPVDNDFVFMVTAR